MSIKEKIQSLTIEQKDCLALIIFDDLSLATDEIIARLLELDLICQGGNNYYYTPIGVNGTWRQMCTEQIEKKRIKEQEEKLLQRNS